MLHQWMSGSCCSEGMYYLRLQGFKVPVNVRNHLTSDAALHPGRWESSITPLLEPQNLLIIHVKTLLEVK